MTLYTRTPMLIMCIPGGFSFTAGMNIVTAATQPQLIMKSNSEVSVSESVKLKRATEEQSVKLKRATEEQAATEEQLLLWEEEEKIEKERKLNKVTVSI